jgi:hypothetical protein
VRARQEQGCFHPSPEESPATTPWRRIRRESPGEFRGVTFDANGV